MITREQVDEMEREAHENCPGWTDTIMSNHFQERMTMPKRRKRVAWNARCRCGHNAIQHWHNERGALRACAAGCWSPNDNSSSCPRFRRARARRGKR